VGRCGALGPTAELSDSGNTLGVVMSGCPSGSMPRTLSVLMAEL